MTDMLASIFINSRKLHILWSELLGELRLLIVIAYHKDSKVRTENLKYPNQLIQTKLRKSNPIRAYLDWI